MTRRSLSDDWTAQREALRRIATHVVAQSQAQATGHFALMPLAGGFGTPQFGSDRRRVRVAGEALLFENAASSRDGETVAATAIRSMAGASIAELCAAVGFEPDAEFSVGHDTPALGDPNEPLHVEGATVTLIGDWYALGQRAIDAALIAADDPRSSIVRLWPEHFDVGVDLAVGPTSDDRPRVNLGAAAGDSFHEAPYLYVGPWGPERPGPSEFWNAPFGATMSYDDVMGADDPLGSATSFFERGLSLFDS